jgi:hypothetical protein
MKIAIAGPGRSGTSVLVKILAGWGFTAPNEEHHWIDSANAGLESRLGSDSSFDVDKDPWAYQYINNLPQEQLSKYSVLIVPIRNLEFAATSRSVNDRAARHDDGKFHYWKWNDWGTIPGGTVYSTSVAEQERILASGLWRLLEVASSRGMKVLIINYPKFVLDFEYLWEELSPFLDKRITKSEAKAVFHNVVDASKIRQSSETVELSLAEAIGLLEIKSKSISSLSTEIEKLSRTKAELEHKKAELEHKKAELEHKKAELESLSSLKELALNQKRLEIEALTNTLSWKSTLPLRKIRAFFARRQK